MDTPARLSQEIHNLTGEVSKLHTRVAVLEELGVARQKTTDEQISDIKNDLKVIRGDTRWLVRVVFASLIGALLFWIYNGGLAGVQ